MSRAEVSAGGFSAIDGTVAFYSRVQALLPPKGVVVDFGAGRGKWMDDDCAWRRDLADLRGEGRLVVAADVDPAVNDNAGVDAAVMLDADGKLPFKTGSVDLLVADWVFEHLAHPSTAMQEFARILSPGGWICARTPNRWGYIALGARLVPRQLHVWLLGAVQPTRQERDIFPTLYRLNTRSAIRRIFPVDRWLDCTYTFNPDPDYVGQSAAAYRAVSAWQRLMPDQLSTTFHVFLQRR